MLSTSLRLGLPSGSLLLDFSAKALRMTHLPYACYMPHESRPSWFHHPNNIGRKVLSMKPLICNFIHLPVTEERILFSAFYSEALSI